MKGKALFSVVVGAGLYWLGLSEFSINDTDGSISAFVAAQDGCVERDLELDQNMTSDWRTEQTNDLVYSVTVYYTISRWLD
jgi:hypothetical protein